MMMMERREVDQVGLSDPKSILRCVFESTLLSAWSFLTAPPLSTVSTGCEHQKTAAQLSTFPFSAVTKRLQKLRLEIGFKTWPPPRDLRLGLPLLARGRPGRGVESRCSGQHRPTQQDPQQPPSPLSPQGQHGGVEKLTIHTNFCTA